MNGAKEREKFILALQAVERARYLLGVIDAQSIGNTSEAWSVGVRRLRESVEEVDRLYAR